MNETVVDIYKQKRIRSGKTQKDRNDGAFKRNADNKTLRDDWLQKNRGKNGNPTPFPTHTCNGHRTRALRARPAKRG